MPWNFQSSFVSPPYIYFSSSLLLFTSSLCFFLYFFSQLNVSTSFLFFPLYIYYLYLFIFFSYFLVSFCRFVIIHPSFNSYKTSFSLGSLIKRKLRHRIRNKRLQLLSPVILLSSQDKEHTGFAHCRTSNRMERMGSQTIYTTLVVRASEGLRINHKSSHSQDMKSVDWLLSASIRTTESQGEEPGDTGLPDQDD
jgi:hypothetical protein